MQTSQKTNNRSLGRKDLSTKLQEIQDEDTLLHTKGIGHQNQKLEENFDIEKQAHTTYDKRGTKYYPTNMSLLLILA